jgi:hypothetical protein
MKKMKRTPGFYQSNGKSTQLWNSSVEFAENYSTNYGFDMSKGKHVKHVAVQLFDKKRVDIATHPFMIEKTNSEIIESLSKNLKFAFNPSKKFGRPNIRKEALPSLKLK